MSIQGFMPVIHILCVCCGIHQYTTGECRAAVTVPVQSNSCEIEAEFASKIW